MMYIRLLLNVPRMVDPKRLNLNQLHFLWLNLAVCALTFKRLLNASESKSYGYWLYIYFLADLSRPNVDAFIAIGAELSSDNYWADFKGFELGLIFFHDPMTMLLPTPGFAGLKVARSGLRALWLVILACASAFMPISSRRAMSLHRV